MRVRPSLSALLGLACTFAFGGPVNACDLALALAVDISGSVDEREFEIQMRGLAEGLRDPEVSEALVRNRAAVMLVQWTGTARQAVSVPWMRVSTPGDLTSLADRIEATPRLWSIYSTAIGEALLFTAAEFSQVADCTRRVIDVSGDGPSNEGIEPADLHAALGQEGITVNALVIEEGVTGLRDYYRQNVIAGPGAFVLVANSFRDYPARMREKLRRETERQLSMLAPRHSACRDCVITQSNGVITNMKN